MAGFSTLCLVLFAKTFPSDWTQPWKAASVGLAFSVLFVYMLSRWGSAVGHDGYLELEREIVLQDLSTDEIRRRFVKQLIGPDAAE